MATRKSAPRKAADDDQHDEGAPRAEQPGERRAIWIITRLEQIQDDPDMAIDARNLLAELTPLSQRYLSVLLREGPVSNTRAATLLKAQEPELEDAIVELENTIREILEDEE
ncbi:MAG: hypothetical protein AB2A00_03115 [Myxococcota bacterium]